MSSSDSSFSGVGKLISKNARVSAIFHGGGCGLTLLLLLLSGGGVRGTTSSRGSATSGGGGTTTGTDVHEEVLDVLALEGLGEESGPDGLNLGDLGGGDERLELVGLFAKCVSRMFSGDNGPAMPRARAHSAMCFWLAILLILCYSCPFMFPLRP
jgi:hypothetical protein